jgi:heat shock protein HslJ
MRRTLLLTMAPVIAFALSALPSLALQGTPEPEGGIPPVVWQLMRIAPPTGSARIPDDPSKYTLQFLPDGKVNVRADCNSGQGRYATDGVKLTIEEVTLTLIGCEPNSLGNEFASILAFVNSFAVIFDELVVTATDGTTLHLVPALTGVVWEWQQFIGGDNRRSAPDDPSRYAITFKDDGSFAVRADCNSGSGAYTVDGASIDLKLGPVTRVKCPPDSQSEEFLRDLDDAASYFFRDGLLNLELMADAGTLVFIARPFTTEGTPAPGAGTPAGE